MHNSHLKRVVGIALEPAGAREFLSEDLVYVEQATWTDSDRHRIRNDCVALGILDDDLLRSERSEKEYPDDY